VEVKRTSEKESLLKYQEENFLWWWKEISKKKFPFFKYFNAANAQNIPSIRITTRQTTNLKKR
jgi:UDP-glucose 4-epimerase